MVFHLDKDLAIFEPLFERRPEVSKDALKQELTRYYLPYAQKLIQLKHRKENDQAVLVGVSAIQGAGKTTQGEILEILLQFFGYSSVSRSIDDHYLTHAELCELREKDPRFIRRGVTHDIPLAVTDLKALQLMSDGDLVLVSGYDKGLHHGDGDRLRWVNLIKGMSLKARVFESELMVSKKMQSLMALQLTSLSFENQPIDLPLNMGSVIPLLEPTLSKELIDFLNANASEEITITQADEDTVSFKATSVLLVKKEDLPHGWRLVNKKPDFIFYDGWMLGARTIADESAFDVDLPALETSESRQFAKDVNKKLSEYNDLWEMIEFMNVLFVKDYHDSLKWRDQAEDALREKGEGMSHDEIREFIYYFWRSVHPAIHIKRLAMDSENTQQVVVINDDHSVGDVLKPNELAERYP